MRADTLLQLVAQGMCTAVRGVFTFHDLPFSAGPHHHTDQPPCPAAPTNHHRRQLRVSRPCCVLRGVRLASTPDSSSTPMDDNALKLLQLECVLAAKDREIQLLRSGEREVST